MKIVAVDPGHNETGVAVLDSDHWHARQFANPLSAWSAIEDELDDTQEVHFLVEDYRSGGFVTKEAKTTIGLVKFFKLAADYYHSYQVTVFLPVEQARLSGQREAAELMGDTIENLVKDPKRKDAFSALAHCISHRRKYT